MKLEWRKATYPDRTYHAVVRDRTYTVDHDGSRWTVRGWDGHELVLANHGPTRTSVKKLAEEHAAEHSD